ncbi:MAG: hypothetical protein U1E18_07605 [Brevundimonas sp.]|uniref:hypothetical protein n=1 Tax=Brevundimonas sp. TaxID=1871086 RepID=UPI002ABA9E8B|nr:hypothetical protein [Brevundimonas sp.]MDZ4109448.1 hypothetical protein [Brevundimonas sp.]
MTRTVKHHLTTAAATGLMLGVMAFGGSALAAPVSPSVETSAKGPAWLVQDQDPRRRPDPNSRPQDPSRESVDDPRQQYSRRVSEAEAQRIAQSRAGGARYVGYMGMRGRQHVFRFEERDGRVFDIGVAAER